METPTKSELTLQYVIEVQLTLISELLQACVQTNRSALLAVRQQLTRNGLESETKAFYSLVPGLSNQERKDIASRIYQDFDESIQRALLWPAPSS